MRKTLLRSTILSALLLAGTGSAFANSYWAALGDREVTVVLHDGAWQEIGGRTVPLAASARIDHFVASSSSWWAGAVEPTAEGDRMILLQGAADAVKTLPSPTLEVSGVLLQPTFVLNGDGPEALVWIEGDDHQKTRVRAARWSGAGWSAPITVSPVGAGTQIALQAARLADGSILATWAAFDGKDDEIVWSRFDGKAWSAPAPISANEVPDVTPALKAFGDGALVVWSGYDGNDYRLYSAAFQNGAWRDGQSFGGRGSIFPVFAATDIPVVSFQQTDPQAWAFVELGKKGRVMSRTFIDPQKQRPTVVAGSADGIELSVVGRRKAADGSFALDTARTRVEWSHVVD